MTAASSVDLLAAGGVALEELRWADARQAFEAAAREHEVPEAYEGIGAACYWLVDGPATIVARVRRARVLPSGSPW